MPLHFPPFHAQLAAPLAAQNGVEENQPVLIRQRDPQNAAQAEAYRQFVENLGKPIRLDEWERNGFFAPLFPAVTAKGDLPVSASGTTLDFLKITYGIWPAPGIDYDPDIVLQAPLEWAARFNASPDRIHLWTKTLTEPFPTEPWDLSSSNYLEWQHHFFGGRTRVEGSFAVPLSVDARSGNISAAGHEAIHALWSERTFLLDLLGSRAVPNNIGEDEVWGHGPILEKIIASGETSPHTARRHQILENVVNDMGANVFTGEYARLYTEQLAYLDELLANELRSGNWKRLPATREELWAALIPILGGPDFDPRQDPELAKAMAAPQAAAFPNRPFDNVAGRQGIAILAAPLKSFSTRQKIAYFKKALPDLYGNLLQLSGDPHGKTRLGLAADPVHAMAFAQQIIRQAEAGRSYSWPTCPQEEWERMAAKVEPSTFPALASLAIQNGNADALGALLAQVRQEDSAHHSLLNKEQKSALLAQAETRAMRFQGERNPQDILKNVSLLLEYGADPATPFLQNGVAAPLSRHALVFMREIVEETDPRYNGPFWPASDWKDQARRIEPQSFSAALSLAITRGNGAMVTALLETTHAPEGQAPQNRLSQKDLDALFRLATERIASSILPQVSPAATQVLTALLRDGANPETPFAPEGENESCRRFLQKRNIDVSALRQTPGQIAYQRPARRAEGQSEMALQR